MSIIIIMKRFKKIIGFAILSLPSLIIIGISAYQDGFILVLKAFGITIGFLIAIYVGASLIVDD